MKIQPMILSLLVILSISQSCVNPVVQKEIKETKKYAEIGNEFFFGFNYGIDKSYYQNHLNDLVMKKELTFDKIENLYFCTFTYAITNNSGNTYTKTLKGKLDPEFDSSYGLYKLTIHLPINNTIEKSCYDDLHYFCELYSNKYGKCDTLCRVEDCYYVWKNQKLSIKLKFWTVRSEIMNDPYTAFLRGSDYTYMLHTDIIYCNDSLLRMIENRDKANEERKAKYLIEKSNASNSSKI